MRRGGVNNKGLELIEWRGGCNGRRMVVGAGADACDSVEQMVSCFSFFLIKNSFISNEITYKYIISSLLFTTIKVSSSLSGVAVATVVEWLWWSITPPRCFYKD